jgi:hypothetical protein
MRNYNWARAKEIIDIHASLTGTKLIRASMGMQEDWFWTAGILWENGEYKRELGGEVAGITGSAWATPTIMIEYTDSEGEEKELMIECHDDGVQSGYNPLLGMTPGCLSGPAQLRIDSIPVSPQGD